MAHYPDTAAGALQCFWDFTETNLAAISYKPHDSVKGVWLLRFHQGNAIVSLEAVPGTGLADVECNEALELYLDTVRRGA